MIEHATIVDAVILGIVGISLVFGFVRGFVHEFFSLLAWVGAGWAAWWAMPWIKNRLYFLLGQVPAGDALAFVATFVALLYVFSTLAVRLSGIVGKAGISGTDRAAGGLFGAARGVVVVLILALVIESTPFRASPLWQASLTRPWAGEALDYAKKNFFWRL